LLKHWTTDPKLEGLNPATTWHQEKMADKKIFGDCMASSGSTLHNQSTTDPEIKCLNPARPWHKEKRANKKLVVNCMMARGSCTIGTEIIYWS
jgi:hypothetical protein